MSESTIPGFEALRGFVGRRGWLRNLLVVEVILIVGAVGLDSVGAAVSGSAATASETGNAETITIFAAMLGAYALLLGVVGAVVLVVSVALAARRSGQIAGA